MRRCPSVRPSVQVGGREGSMQGDTSRVAAAAAAPPLPAASRIFLSIGRTHLVVGRSARIDCHPTPGPMSRSPVLEGRTLRSHDFEVEFYVFYLSLFFDIFIDFLSSLNIS